MSVALEVVQQIWAHVQAGDLDALLDYVPDDIIDAVLSSRKTAAANKPSE